ncbi:MAG: response regulator transcription factor [Aquincola sp.]|nr:response regulator transcription factor [Aquincola sp.]|tara:strand:+ start:1191 stop:1943 length:753 start_codon:yes stop_codon:yes gene_type:complete
MNVMLVDDHALFREGLALLLRPLVDPLVVWEAGSCEEALALLDKQAPLQPDLVLMDLGLPGMNGLEGIACFHERLPQCPVVALSSNDDRETVLRALDAGAMGFIPKSSSSAVFAAALRLIMAKGIYLPTSVLAAPVSAARPAPRSALPTVGTQVAAVSGAGPLPADLGITPRQSAVLALILQGMPAKLIARTLNLAPGTVKAHTSAVLRALNVTTRTQAVIEAGRLGPGFTAALAQASGDAGERADGGLA